MAIGLLASTLITGPTFAQTSASDPVLLGKLESLRRDAMTAWQKKDGTALKAIMAPDFHFISPQGVATRDIWLMSLAHCSLKSYDLDQTQLQQLTPDVALLTYKLHYTGDCDGTPAPTDSFVTDTAARRDGKWVIVNTSFIPRM